MVKLFLSNLDFGTSLFESLLQGFSLFLGNAFLQLAGGTVNEILSFLQTEATSFLNGLNDLKLSSTSALQNDVKSRLLLSSSCTTGSRTCGYSNSGCSGFDAILILKDRCQLVYFLYSQINQFFCNSFDICHFINCLLFLFL